MTNRRLPLFARLLIATLAQPGQAREWTRLRGPNGSGQSEASSTRWWRVDRDHDS